MQPGKPEHRRDPNELSRTHVLFPQSGVRNSTVNNAILAALIIGALYVGKSVLLPIAVAILLAFVLSPIVKALRYIRIPRPAAVILVVAVTLTGLVVVGSVLSEQLRILATDFPRYESTLRGKVRDIRGVTTSSPALERAAKTLKDLQSELATPNQEQSAAESAQDLSRIAPGSLSARAAAERRSGDGKPIAVEVHYPAATPLDGLLALATPLVEPIAMIAIIIVFVIFIIVQKEELRDRVIRLSGAHDMQRTTAAMTDAAQRLSRFLLTMTVLNVAYGVFFSVILWSLDIPAPVLWGIVAGLMRFVPFIGSFIAAVGPFALAAAIDPGWNTFLITVGVFIVSEVTMGQVIEPLVQGRSTGLSPLAILVAAAFWTVLWGPVGLLLAIPMTLCLVVLGQHIDGLNFLHVLLGDEPALTASERFYQRTLAGDAAEITELAEHRIKEAPLSVYYEEVAIEGLRLAQSDAERDAISEEHMDVIEKTVETMVDNLWEVQDRMPQSKTDRVGTSEVDEEGDDDDEQEEPGRSRGTVDLPVLKTEDLPEAWKVQGAVACVPAQSLVDRAAAHVVSHLVTRHGIDAAVVDWSEVGRGNSGPPPEEVRLVCVCSLSEHLAATRFLARRIRRRLRHAHIVVILLNADEQKAEGLAASSQDPRLHIVRNLRETVATIISTAVSNEEATPNSIVPDSSKGCPRPDAAAVA